MGGARHGTVPRSALRLFVGFLLSGAMLWAANPPPLISITAPAAGASILGPTPIVLEAAASSPDVLTTRS